jgi:hypothetical protein
MEDKKKWEDIGRLLLDIDYSWNPAEKRQYERIDIKFLRRLTFEGIIQIEAEITYDKTYIMQGIIKDLSKGGLKIYLPMSLPIKDGSKLSVKFKIGERNFDVNAISRWHKEENHGNCFDLQFIKLSPQEEKFLTSLYSSLMYR